GDFEDVVFLGVSRDRVRISEESVPEIREFQLTTGVFISAFARPPVYDNRRSNFGFESVGLAHSQYAMWTANEEALTVDGPLSTSSAGTTVRLLKYSGSPLVPVAEYAYSTDPVHGLFISSSRSGVSQVVPLPNGRLLVLERSFGFGSSFFQTR